MEKKVGKKAKPNQTIVVTGASGALGSNVVRLALEEGHQVIAVTRGSGVLPEFSRDYERRTMGA